jgi:hypothetical protein
MLSFVNTTDTDQQEFDHAGQCYSMSLYTGIKNVKRTSCKCEDANHKVYADLPSQECHIHSDGRLHRG